MPLVRLKPGAFALAFPQLRTTLVRERLMAMVKLRLQQIQVANGYLTDFGLKVHRGQLIVAEPEPESINFWDPSEDNRPVGSALQENALVLVVATYDKKESVGDENPEDV